jgi:hypothetical protein
MNPLRATSKRDVHPVIYHESATRSLKRGPDLIGEPKNLPRRGLLLSELNDGRAPSGSRARGIGERHSRSPGQYAAIGDDN